MNIDTVLKDLGIGVGDGGGVKSVQSFEVNVLIGESSKNVTIASVDMSKSIIIVHGSYGTSGETGNLAKFAGIFISDVEVQLKRGQGGAARSVTFSVIEFDNVKSKQSGYFTKPTTTTKDITISPINLSKSLLVVDFSITSPNLGVFSYNFVNESSFRVSEYQKFDGMVYYWDVIEFK